MVRALFLAVDDFIRIKHVTFCCLWGVMFIGGGSLLSLVFPITIQNPFKKSVESIIFPIFFLSKTMKIPWKSHGNPMKIPWKIRISSPSVPPFAAPPLPGLSPPSSCRPWCCSAWCPTWPAWRGPWGEALGSWDFTAVPEDFTVKKNGIWPSKHGFFCHHQSMEKSSDDTPWRECFWYYDHLWSLKWMWIDSVYTISSHWIWQSHGAFND